MTDWIKKWTLERVVLVGSIVLSAGVGYGYQSMRIYNLETEVAAQRTYITTETMRRDEQGAVNDAILRKLNDLQASVNMLQQNELGLAEREGQAVR